MPKALPGNSGGMLPGKSRAEGGRQEEEEDEGRKVENEVMNVILTREQRKWMLLKVTLLGKRHLWPGATRVWRQSEGFARGNQLEMAATNMHDDVLPGPKECHEWATHCAFAHLDSLVARVAGARGDKDATGGRSGGAERAVWETLLEMERFVYRTEEKDQGAITLVLDSAEAVERVTLSVVWACATHFNDPRKILRVLCGYFEHRRRVQFRGRVAEPLQTITAIFPQDVSASEVEGFCG